MVSCQDRKPENNKFYIFKKTAFVITPILLVWGKIYVCGTSGASEPDVNGLNLAFWKWEGERNILEGNLLNLMRSKGLLRTVQSKERIRMIAKLL